MPLDERKAARAGALHDCRPVPETPPRRDRLAERAGDPRRAQGQGIGTEHRERPLAAVGEGKPASSAPRTLDAACERARGLSGRETAAKLVGAAEDRRGVGHVRRVSPGRGCLDGEHEAEHRIE